jgi:hypothetical protein
MLSTGESISTSNKSASGRDPVGILPVDLPQNKERFLQSHLLHKEGVEIEYVPVAFAGRRTMPVGLGPYPDRAVQLAIRLIFPVCISRSVPAETVGVFDMLDVELVITLGNLGRCGTV